MSGIQIPPKAYHRWLPLPLRCYDEPAYSLRTLQKWRREEVFTYSAIAGKSSACGDLMVKELTALLSSKSKTGIKPLNVRCCLITITSLPQQFLVQSAEKLAGTVVYYQKAWDRNLWVLAYPRKILYRFMYLILFYMGISLRLTLKISDTW